MSDYLTVTLPVSNSGLNIVAKFAEIHLAGNKYPLVFLPLEDYILIGCHPSNFAVKEYATSNPYEGYSLFGVRLIATDNNVVVTNGNFTLEVIK